MCGIAGLVANDGLAPDARRRTAAMCDVLTHRGPDAAGIHSDEYAALGHRRLSIVDLSGGVQPMSNEDRTIWVSFNGEIYNHAEIRRVLESAGHVYRTKSDTETIVHAYEEWGEECVQRFRGMFAFAIWNATTRQLLVVRDRLGIKPVYWMRVGDTLAFASEIKALLASGLIEPEANDAVFPELLATRYVSGPETLFKGIHKLLPGHLLTFGENGVHIRQYWDLPQDQAGAVRATKPADIPAQFRSLFEEAIRLRLMADVPLGMFLSGGIDSSAVAALMAGMIDRPLQTFSVAFNDRACNELEYARDVARAIGADQHEVVIDDGDFFDALPRMIWHEDEPIAHPSSIPLYFVSQLARRHVKVVLTGEGSDELLAGYGKYPRIAWNWRAGTVYEHTLPSVVRQGVAQSIVPGIPGQLGRYARRSFLAMARTPEAMIFDNFASIRLSEQRQLLHSSRRSGITAESAYASSLSYFNRSAGASLLRRILYADVKTYLVELLMKQDQMSMAASIESRVPFLDHRLVEWVSTLPDEWKLAGWTTKRILRESMKGVLPAEILNRPKMGFPVPFSRWTRGRWNDAAREVLLDRQTRERGVFDPQAIDSLVSDHAAGRTDAGDRIWSLLNLELWHRTFIDRQGIQTLAAPHKTYANTLAEIGSAAAAR
ncbi:MAG TPA: asparagine synthase (glutamine-hydrolyzing) [Vicinamibacterales bacterium]|nr:asparagine synthase (glutamine-hydrolyzing) [Vicinamibacterales bacterium]